MGEMEDFLGLTIVRDRSTRTLYVHQQPYAAKILKRFHMEDCLPSRSPAATTEILSSHMGQAT